MKKDEFYETALLYLMDELDENEKIRFENYLFEDNEAKSIFNKIQRTHRDLLQTIPEPVDNKALDDARRKLRLTLHEETEKRSYPQKLFSAAAAFLGNNYRAAFSTAAALFAGIIIGYLLFSSSITNNTFTADKGSIEDIDLQNVAVSNIRFARQFSDNGEIEVMFDAQKPVIYKAKSNDALMQKILALALITAKNPAVRIQTVSALSSQRSNLPVEDPKIKKALITAATIDENPAVRKEALLLLMSFPFDADIRDALIYVLSYDENPGLRITAINAFSDLKLKGVSVDEKIKNVLTNKKESDDNDFVRLRAANLLQGE